MNATQVMVFAGITALIAFATWMHVRGTRKGPQDERDYFLAGGSLSWIFVAGSITLTNLSTDQLVSMNGNQMLLVAWWEFAAVAGLFILAYVFLPVYYREKCTTTTELLQKKFGDSLTTEFKTTPELIGGMRVKVGSDVWDGSVKAKLNRLSDRL